jgi:Uma2 family endonuclease
MTLEVELIEKENEIMADGVSGVIGARLTTFLSLHVMNQNLGWVFNADTDFVIAKRADGSDLKRRPDIAFCSFATLPEIPRSIVPVPPDLAIEVSSSRDEVDDTDKKVKEYRQAKIKLVWVIRPIGEVVEIYRKGEVAGLLGVNDELNGEDVIPGFTLPVKNLFAYSSKTSSV